eukprot:NODE_1368_length_1535_cov_4.343040_g1295_i0.p2 GENE.NODE_1368_length_1535_cov_4.343040_g1295_i0~~NODE_1368_length_1535_cov_4.343040_g1295_i0.p2  ORF type:complete len:200 (+),score=39.46 NODE_1368_length_1535_cov_4.343040_g1295_i0:891-1490(+)
MGTHCRNSELATVVPIGGPPAPRYLHSAVVLNGDMILFGGWEAISLNDVWELTLATAEPTPSSTATPTQSAKASGSSTPTGTKTATEGVLPDVRKDAYQHTGKLPTNDFYIHAPLTLRFHLGLASDPHCNHIKTFRILNGPWTAGFRGEDTRGWLCHSRDGGMTWVRALRHTFGCPTTVCCQCWCAFVQKKATYCKCDE